MVNLELPFFSSVSVLYLFGGLDYSELGYSIALRPTTSPTPLPPPLLLSSLRLLHLRLHCQLRFHAAVWPDRARLSLLTSSTTTTRVSDESMTPTQDGNPRPNPESLEPPKRASFQQSNESAMNQEYLQPIGWKTPSGHPPEPSIISHPRLLAGSTLHNASVGDAKGHLSCLGRIAPRGRKWRA